MKYLNEDYKGGQISLEYYTHLCFSISWSLSTSVKRFTLATLGESLEALARVSSRSVEAPESDDSDLDERPLASFSEADEDRSLSLLLFFRSLCLLLRSRSLSLLFLLECLSRFLSGVLLRDLDLLLDFDLSLLLFFPL